VSSFVHADDRSIYSESFFKHSQMQFTLFTYFQTSCKTFLLFFLLAHQARSRLLQLTRYINYLLTYLLNVLISLIIILARLLARVSWDQFLGPAREFDENCLHLRSANADKAKLCRYRPIFLRTFPIILIFWTCCFRHKL